MIVYIKNEKYFTDILLEIMREVIYLSIEFQIQCCFLNFAMMGMGLCKLQFLDTAEVCEGRH